MAYKPTAKDFDDGAGYMPTQQDFSSQESAAPQQQDQSLLSMAANNPVTNFILGAGDAPRRTLTGIANLIPHAMGREGLPFEPASSGTAYNVGNVAGDIAQYMGPAGAIGMGRAALAEASTLAGSIAQMLGRGAPGLAARVGANAGYGALTNPENPEKGAIVGGLAGAGGEAIPGLVKGVGALAEKVHPVAYTNAMVGALKKTYDKSLGEAENLYNEALGRTGESTFNPVKYKEVKPNVKRAYSLDAKELEKEFLDNPTIDNAHKLQSEIGSSASKILRNVDESAAKKELAGRALKARDALQKEILEHMNRIDPGSEQLYAHASHIYKNEVAPFWSTSKLYNIASGSKTEARPAELANHLRSVLESKKKNIPEQHALRTAYENLLNKIHKGQAISDVVPLLGGIAGAGEGAEGAGVGGFAAKMFGNAGTRLGTNPVVRGAVQSAEPAYDLIKQALTGALVPRSNQ